MYRFPYMDQKVAQLHPLAYIPLLELLLLGNHHRRIRMIAMSKFFGIGILKAPPIINRSFCTYLPYLYYVSANILNRSHIVST